MKIEHKEQKKKIGRYELTLVVAVMLSLILGAGGALIYSSSYWRADGDQWKASGMRFLGIEKLSRISGSDDTADDGDAPYGSTGNREAAYEQVWSFCNDKDWEGLARYKAFVTEGGYRLSAFLARDASNHNYGVAVDIALVDMETGEEVEMQTPMHELSPLAATKNNTYMADMLATWMKSYGFTGIVSEWWHFEMKGMKKTYASFQVSPYEEKK